MLSELSFVGCFFGVIRTVLQIGGYVDFISLIASVL